MKSTLLKREKPKEKTRKNRRHKNTKWRFIEIRGNTPYEVGFCHGTQLYKEISTVFDSLPFLIKQDLKKSHTECIEIVKNYIRPIIETQFRDIYDEIRGICDGATSRGVKIPLNNYILWNGYETIRSYFEQNLSGAAEGGASAHERCCAFIATGNATKTGKIVIAHTSHVNYSLGQLFNIILRVYPPPEKGTSFIMQTAAGMVYSSTDWFLTDTGIVGCETTLSDIKKPMRIDDAPIFCRARNAMQYSQSIDDFIKHITQNNAGDYSCAWLVGDTKTGEIARIELAVTSYSTDRTKNGAYVGTNLIYDSKLLIEDSAEEEEKTESLKTSAQNRRARLEYLVNEKYYGKIDSTIGRKILADHYDSAKGKQIKNSHSICKHVELDGTPPTDVIAPFYPSGAFDGKVFDSSHQNTQWIRWGPPCGQVFSAKKHIQEHPQFSIYKNHLEDFRGEPWMQINI